VLTSSHLYWFLTWAGKSVLRFEPAHNGESAPVGSLDRGVLPFAELDRGWSKQPLFDELPAHVAMVKMEIPVRRASAEATAVAESSLLAAALCHDDGGTG
jgi:hypothetical protein